MFLAMMERVAAQAIAATERARAAVRIAVEEFPDLLVEREGDDIVIRGRGLLRRWIDDARLRFAFRGWR